MKVPFKKLKKRWNVQHNWQIVVILIVFALTGTSTVYSYDYLKPWLGIHPETSFLLKTIAFIFIGLPIYNILLIIWGSLLGQSIFFRLFIKRFVQRIFPFLRKK